MSEVEARYVNLKYITNNEWIFFSNYNSPKAQQFSAHNQVSVLIFWPSINTQIRMKASDLQEAFQSFLMSIFWEDLKKKCTSYGSSNQSQVVVSYDEVKKNFHRTLNTMTPETTRPDYWGGFSFVPYYFEF